MSDSKNENRIMLSRREALYLAATAGMGIALDKPVHAMGSAFAQQAATATSESITATIDAGKLGEPISKYLYGMFIENLGSLIYRSLWAELLDDRKFYYPITSAEPPRPGRASFMGAARRWVSVGPDSSVTMDPDNAYVGEHTPKISMEGQAPHGIQQSGLALVKGKSYVGRVVLAGPADAKVAVTLVWGDAPGDRQTVAMPALRSGFAKYPFKFTSNADTDAGRLEVVGRGTGSFRIGAVSIMPADNVQGFRPDTTKLLRELNTGMWRLPGGNFISGYDWRNAIGDPDKRPPIMDYAWHFVQPNDVGMDELMILCKLLGVAPYITVNAGFGDARSSADHVEYANGSTHTPMGALRAANGHPEPYHVKYWNIGNEMYGYWQLGHTALRYYVLKHNEFATYMRKVDPSITLLASGAMLDEMTITANAFLVTGKVQAEYGTPSDWTGGLLEHSLPYLDAVTEHWYAQDGERFNPSIVAKKDIFDPNYSNRDVFSPVSEPLVEELRRPSNRVRLIAEEWTEYKKRFPEIVKRNIFVSIDEWANSSRSRGGSWKIALSYGLVLQEMFRHTDFIKMSAFTMGTSTLSLNATGAVYNDNGLVFKIYRDHFGTIPIDVTGSSPQPAPKFPVGGDQPAINAGSPTFPLDVSAALTPDKKFLTVAVVNPTEAAHHLNLEVHGVRLGGDSTLWQLTGSSLDANNAVGAKPEVSITNTPVSGVPSALTIKPISINIYRIPVQ